ncbi:hypothetical protein [Sinobaca sp. H24]|uniref:hypothetical protein n=1 Tax=Sinobaca sp. H24 TaxID=2923376 RepID=UPI0020793448|nr:hypothetical protein [Sinobaca sp. H24]
MKEQSKESEKRSKEVEAITQHNREALIDAAKSVEVLKDIMIKEGIMTEEDYNKRKSEVHVSIDKYLK